MIIDWQEFALFATAHIFSLISPGPDFLMVVRSSLRYNRQAALWVAVGISCGELIHIAYSILGLGYFLAERAWLLDCLKLLGSGYLIFIGIQSVKNAAALITPIAQEDNSEPLHAVNSLTAFSQGFFTNALNIKAAFFTLSFFTLLVKPSTPWLTQVFYGVFIQLSTLLWFSMVALFLTHAAFQARFLKAKPWIEGICGFLLIALGLSWLFVK